MSLPHRHVIDSAVFDLEVPDTGVVAVDYVRTRLLALAEAIFDEVAEPGRVVRIDRLELDLGVRPAGGDWAGELERRFEEKLREELKNHLEASAVPGEAAALDVLVHLLRTGTLPWTGWSGGGDDSLDAFAHRVIRTDPGGFARLLRSAPEAGVVVDRLVRQTSDATLAAALAALAGGGVEEWARRLRRAGTSTPDGMGTPVGAAIPGESPPRDGPWTPGGTGTAPDGRATPDGAALRRAWARDLLHRMLGASPPRTGGGGGSPAPASVPELAPASAPASRGHGDAGLGKGSSRPGGRTSPGADPRRDGAVDRVAEAPPGWATSSREISERLGTALRTGRLDPAAAELREWVQNRPTVVADTLRALGTSRRIRRGLARLPDSTLLELVRALDPSVVDLVAQLLRNPRDLPGLASGGAGGLPHPEGAGHPEGLRRRVRESVLAHLILQDPVGGGPAPLMEGIRLHIAELEAAGSAPEEGTRGEGRAPVVDRAPGLPSPYALLQQLLHEDPEGAAVPTALEALLAGHPDDLLRLLELVRTSDPVVRRGMALWPAPGVRAVAEALLALVSRKSSDSGSALEEAAAAAGNVVADPRGFYLELIQVIWSGGWIDLERLREAHRGTGEGKGKMWVGEAVDARGPGLTAPEGASAAARPAASPSGKASLRLEEPRGPLSPTPPRVVAPGVARAAPPGEAGALEGSARRGEPHTQDPDVDAGVVSASPGELGDAPEEGRSPPPSSPSPSTSVSPTGASATGVGTTPAPPSAEGSTGPETPPTGTLPSPGPAPISAAAPISGAAPIPDAAAPAGAGSPARPGPLPGSAPLPGGGTSAPGRPGVTGASPAGLVQRLLEQATGGAPEDTPDPAHARELRRAVESALSQDAAPLRRVLEEALEEADAADALIAVLPGPTLARVFLLLRPGAGDLLRAVDVVAGAAFQQRRDVAGVEREKWRFLFRRLVAEGRLPVLEDTVRAFFDLLLRGPADAAAAKALPGDGAPADTAPADAAAGPAPPGGPSGDAPPRDAARWEAAPMDGDAGDADAGGAGTGPAPPGRSDGGASEGGGSVEGRSGRGSASGYAPGESAPGAPATGESVPGEVAARKSAEGDPAGGSSPPGRFAPGEPAPESSAPPESSKGESAAREPAAPESAAPGSAAGLVPPERSVGGESGTTPGSSASGAAAGRSTPLDPAPLLDAVRARVAARTLTTPAVGQRILEALSRPRTPRESIPASGALPPSGTTPPSGRSSPWGSSSGGASGATSGMPPAAPSGATPRASREIEMTPHREAGPAWTTTETLFIGNAGIVLAAPYLPRLFSMLDLATERAFHSPEHAARGAHLIQCLVEGRPDRPEYLLPLNKILCGLGENDVLPASILPTPREEEMVSGLLSALIQNWGALGSTTTEGLQESFFQREGALRAQGEAWRLQVEPRAFDMLIDRMPWSFNIIRFGWMDRVLHVEWRG